MNPQSGLGIRAVEIEIDKYCNRACNWCPNNYINRRSHEEMPTKTYMDILDNLYEFNYKGVISFSRYNEPMANLPLLMTRANQAKEFGFKTVTNTNGDFLKNGSLTGLSIDELTVMDYDCHGLNDAIKKMHNAGIEVKEIEYPFVLGNHEDMKVLYYVDFPMHQKMEDRGGALHQFSHEHRKEPCLEPKHSMVIDYNGKVMPCCNLRSDVHTDWILGDANEEKLTDIYISELAIFFREKVARSSFPEPCLKCKKKPGRYTRDEPSIRFSSIHTRKTGKRKATK
jgi:radical SAM protein with 4Fe4S-binding SPASM domain